MRDNDSGESQARFDRIVGEYLDRLSAGEGVDPLDVLHDHPDLGDAILCELRTFIDLGSPVSEASVPLRTLGDYTLRRPIGRGGMGVVYEAWQGSMDRVVALKVLPPGVAADDKAFHRFMREAKTAGKLDHRNIVSVHAAGFDQNTPYYAMEYGVKFKGFCKPI